MTSDPVRLHCKLESFHFADGKPVVPRPRSTQPRTSSPGGPEMDLSTSLVTGQEHRSGPPSRNRSPNSIAGEVPPARGLPDFSDVPPSGRPPRGPPGSYPIRGPPPGNWDYQRGRGAPLSMNRPPPPRSGPPQVPLRHPPPRSGPSPGPYGPPPPRSGPSPGPYGPPPPRSGPSPGPYGPPPPRSGPLQGLPGPPPQRSSSNPLDHRQPDSTYQSLPTEGTTRFTPISRCLPTKYSLSYADGVGGPAGHYGSISLPPAMPSQPQDRRHQQPPPTNTLEHPYKEQTSQEHNMVTRNLINLEPRPLEPEPQGPFPKVPPTFPSV